MSLKRQLQFRYLNLVNRLKSVSLPGWMGSKTVRIILVVLIVIVGGAYVAKINSSATRGFEMHKLEKQVNSLDGEIQKIQIEIAENSSLSSIQTRLAKLDMTEASALTYITPKDTAVAKR